MICLKGYRAYATVHQEIIACCGLRKIWPVVGCGSETQLRVGGNLCKYTWQDKSGGGFTRFSSTEFTVQLFPR